MLGDRARMIPGIAAPARLSAIGYAEAERRRTTLLAGAAFLAALGSAWLVVLIQFASVVILLTWAGLIAMAWSPMVGLFSAFGLMIMFEQSNPDPLMAPGNYLLDTIGKSGITGVILTPIEVLLLLTLAFWLARGLVKHKVDFRGGSLGWPMLAFLVVLVAGLVRGALGGGDLYLALWECRYLFQLVICFFLASNVVRTRGHVRLLLTLALLASAFFAVEGAYRRIFLLDSGVLNVIMEFAYAHDSVVFLGTILLVVIAQHVFGAPRWQRIAGPLIFVIAGYTLLATERRAGYIAVMVGFIELGAMLFFIHRKAFILVVIPVLIGTAIYLPIFWNASGPAAQPARAIRSIRDPDPRDAQSNMARDLERLNILATMQQNPLVGVGFGRPYVVAVGIPDISFFPLWNYETHNSVQWVRMKTGPLGFVVFMVVMCSALALAAHHVRRSKDRDVRVFAVLAISAVTATLVFSYVDLGFTSGRVCVFLGTILGTLSVLDRLPSEEAVTERLPRLLT